MTAVMPRGVYEIPADKLVSLIQEQADKPDSPVVFVVPDSWGRGVRRVVSVQREEDGCVVVEMT